MWHRKERLGFLLLSALLAAAALLISCGDDDDDDNDSTTPPINDDDDATPDDDDDITPDDDDDDATPGDDDDDDASPDDDDDDDATPGDDDDDDATPGDDDDDNNDDATPVVGCIQGTFEPYWGLQHAHTGYSDGELTPEDAFIYARDQGALDFMIVTDHVEQLYLPWPEGDKWEKCLADADAAYDPGYYLTDCGFEYGSGFILPWFTSTGHNNVFSSPDPFPIVQLDFHNFYDSLVHCPTCVGQFNHPDYDSPNTTWNDWEYFENVNDQLTLMEFNGESPQFDVFMYALSKGWRLSPIWDQDNHDADWGTKNDHRTGFYLSELTREAWHFGMMARMSFATSDKNASIKMMTDDACWMGSVISGYTSLTLDVEVMDLDDGDGFVSVSLYAPDMSLLSQADCLGQTVCEASFDVEFTAPTYFVARADETDGDWLVAAPIWIE